MDDHTLEKLDFERIRQWLARYASCALGRRLALRVWPSKKYKQVAHWLQQTEEMGAFVADAGVAPFGGVRDVRDLVRRAVPPNKLEPAEFGEIADTLNGAANIRAWLEAAEEKFETLKHLRSRVGDLQVIRDRITKIIDSRGEVRDEASERLLRIRNEINNLRDEQRNLFDKLIKQPSITKYLQYPEATFHADRMVLPLRADQRGRVPGIVHRTSDSGQTLFVEPSQAVELNNRRLALVQQERDEIGRILWELTHLIHLNRNPLIETLDALAVLDLLNAKVKFADRFNMRLAKLNEDGRVNISHARNPVLVEMYEDAQSPDYIEPMKGQPRAVVPIDARLGEDFDIMLITGPNTGGKTAALKTVGLLSLMTQAGLPIPAATGSTLPVFNGIWIDVGDEQSLQQSLSTFSAHMERILDIIRRARKNMLVLIDELGAGTDPDEGAAIGKAIIDELLKSGCVAMITTHLGALKAIGFEAERVDNASVEFDIETLSPTYHLRIGEPGNSNAIAIASRLGMPKKLVSAAKKNLTRRGRALNKAIAGTLDARRAAEQARRDAEQARQQAARETLAALDKAREIEAKLAEADRWLERVVRLQPGDPVRVKKFDDPGKIVRVRIDKQKAAVSIGALEVEVPFSELVFMDD